jgi:F-type H+-transporting ATPase subunit epsilon
MLQLNIVTPKEQVLDAKVREVIVPGYLGYMGFQPGHAPLVSSLTIGRVEYSDISGNWHILLIHGGFVEVRNNVVTVLADDVEKPADIDFSSVRRELAEHEARLHKATEEEFETISRDLELAKARSEISDKQ